MGDSFVGIQARLMSQALRKLTGAVSRSNTALVFTNQLREKIGVMFGNPETTPGGRALKFYASVRLDIRRIETIKSGTDSDRQPRAGQGRQEQGRRALPGGGVRRHVRRGHLPRGRPPGRRRRLGLVTKTGAWFTYGETRLGQGREQAKEFLRTNRDVPQQLETEIRRKIATIDVPVEGISEAE